jgi:integrase
MTKLTPPVLRRLIKKPGRHADGQGLYFRATGDSKAYFVYRFRTGGREREMSLGPYPETTLEQARAKHAGLRAQVLNKVDPLAGRRYAKGGLVTNSGVPTFGAMADAYIAAHEGSWRSSKHATQWWSTLRTHAAALRDMPVDQVDTEAVLGCLRPIWAIVPETASRVRARIEIILASAAVAGHIPADRPNPARWGKWLDLMLPSPKKVGKPRGHHAAMPYAELPAFMARLAEIDSVASRALQLTILCATRTSETLGATFDEIDLEAATWSIGAERMKMKKRHDVPLSEQALAILRRQHDERGENPHVFGGRPMRGLSNMSLSMLLRRLKIDATVHGMRSAARSWMADQGVPFEVAEAALAHTVGNAVVQAYQRSSMLDLRRPVLQKWADYVCADNVVDLKRGAAASTAA